MKKEKLLGAVIAAGGNGSRFGENKLMLNIHDKPLFLYPVEAALKSCAKVVLVVPKSNLEHYKEITPSEVIIVEGGSTRSESVYQGLLALQTDWVAVMDAARPLQSASLITLAFREAMLNDCGVVVGTKVIDTIKEISGGKIIKTVDRNHLFAAQTPQIFKRELLLSGYQHMFEKKLFPTDDTAVYQFLKLEVRAYLNDSPNPKITYRSDLLPILSLFENEATH